MTSSTTSNTSPQESASGASEQVTGTNVPVTTLVHYKPDDDLIKTAMSYRYPKVEGFDHINSDTLVIQFMDIVQKLIQRENSDDDVCYIRLRAKGEPETVTIEIKSDMIKEKKTPFELLMDQYKLQIDKCVVDEATINRLQEIGLKFGGQVIELTNMTSKLRKRIKAMAFAMVAMAVVILFMALN